MARRSRSRELAGLAALGALGYSIFGAEGRRRKDGTVAPVEYRGTDRPPTVRGDMSSADLYADAALAQQPEIREHVFDAPMGVRENVFDPGAAQAAQAVRPAAAPARATAPNPARATAPQYDPRLAGLSAASIGASEAAAINRAREERQAPARQAAQRARYGVPISPPPDAPSIYASPAVRQAYRQGQAIERSVAPATQQGSARNIVQQMRQRDAGLPERMRQRQQEQAAAAEQRRIEAEMNLDPSERLMRGYKKGGAVKAKPKTQAKKMSSGGMSSASKRADGIATKGKTKCKMY